MISVETNELHPALEDERAITNNRSAKQPPVRFFKQVGLLMIWAAVLHPAGIVSASPTTDRPSGGAVVQSTTQKSKLIAQELRRTLDAKVNQEAHRPGMLPIVHIDDLIARFIRPGMTMSDAEAIMKSAGLHLSTIDAGKIGKGAVLYLLEYRPSPISTAFAVISIFPTAGPNASPTVARIAAQINNSTL